MERFLMDELVAWKDGPRRKPLILNGARQVGKTWLLKEFGRTQFENVAYVNLDDNPRMREQLELGYDIPRIVLAIQFETGEVVSEGGALIVLDEIQACPKALTSLKYFCEDAPGWVRGGRSRLASGHHRARGQRVPRGEGEHARSPFPELSGVPRRDGESDALRPHRHGRHEPHQRLFKQARSAPSPVLLRRGYAGGSERLS